MLEAQIPKDIRKYETKLVGPFTTRQIIFVIIACVLAYITYIFTKAPEGCVLVAIPPVVFGYIKPYGMPLEKFIKTAFISNVLSPKNRLYKVNNIFAKCKGKMKPMDLKEYKKRKRQEKKQAKTNDNYICYS